MVVSDLDKFVLVSMESTEMAIPAGQSPEAAALYTRIDDIINTIPADWRSRESVVHLLRSRQESIPYTPPSGISQRWQEVSSILGAWLPDPATCTWAADIATLFGAPI